MIYTGWDRFCSGVIRKTLDALLKSFRHLTSFFFINFEWIFELFPTLQLCLFDRLFSEDLEDIHRFYYGRPRKPGPVSERKGLSLISSWVLSEMMMEVLNSFVSPQALKQHWPSLRVRLIPFCRWNRLFRKRRSRCESRSAGNRNIPVFLRKPLYSLSMYCFTAASTACAVSNLSSFSGKLNRHDRVSTYLSMMPSCSQSVGSYVWSRNSKSSEFPGVSSILKGTWRNGYHKKAPSHDHFPLFLTECFRYRHWQFFSETVWGQIFRKSEWWREFSWNPGGVWNWKPGTD